MAVPARGRNEKAAWRRETPMAVPARGSDEKGL